MHIKIAYLKDHPDKIPALANLWHKVLGSIWAPDITIERVEQRFREHLNNNLLPMTFVAFDGNKLVGSVSLRESDGIRPDLMPWLGSLIVDKSYQKAGGSNGVVVGVMGSRLASCLLPYKYQLNANQ